MLAVILQDYARTLLFAHLVCAICALGAAVHLASRLWKGGRDDASRLHATIVAASYSLCYVLGALVYPTFRVQVRAHYFDVATPWATGLFEAKEHLATLGLICALAVVVIVRSGSLVADEADGTGGFAAAASTGEQDRAGVDARPLVWGLLALLVATLLFNAWSGWYLTTLRSI